MAALFTIGTLAILRVFGEPNRPMTSEEWLVQTIASIAVGIGCFFALDRLTDKWSAEGAIPEFSNRKSL